MMSFHVNDEKKCQFVKAYIYNLVHQIQQPIPETTNPFKKFSNQPIQIFFDEKTKKQQQMDNLSIFSIPYSSVPESEHYGKFKTDTKFVFFSLFRISVNAWGWRKNCYHYLTIKFARGLVPRYHGRHHNF